MRTTETSAADIDGPDLIPGVKALSAEAWAAVYDALAPRIFRYALARAGERQAAEDLTSIVFLKALKTIASYDPSRRPLTSWIYGIARHAVADHLRSRRPDARLEEVAPPTVDSASPLAGRLDLQTALAKLTGDQREVVVLHYYAGFSIPEVARLLRKKERAVYSLHARALVTLRKRLESPQR